MPTATAPVAPMPDIAGLVQSKLMGVGSADGFLALLNVAGAQNQPDHGPADVAAKTTDDSKDHDTQDPQAAPMEAPNPIAAISRYDTSSQGVSRNADKARLAVKDTQDASPGAPARATSDSADEPVEEEENQLRTALQNRLGDINQILQAMIQALSGSAPAATVVATQPVVASYAAGQPAAPVDTSAALPADTEVSLLKDIQSLLQQMQQALQAPANTAGKTPADVAALLQNPVPAGAQDSLQALVDSLQQDISKLSQLLASANPKPAANTLSYAQQLAAANASLLPDNLGALLKDSIGQVREQLQKLKAANDNIFAQMKNNMQAQFADASQMFKDMLSANGLSLKDVTVQNNAAPVANTANSGAPVTVTQPIITTNAPQVMAPVAVVVDVAQNGTANSGSNNSGGQQNQATPAPIMAASSSQTQATGSVAPSAFARALGQASAASSLPDQVAFQVKTALRDGSSRIHIQLDPAELGKLEIKIHVASDGKTGVTIIADNKNTLTLLQQDAQGLARALNDAGLTADGGSLSFNLRGGQQEQQGDNAQAALTYQGMQPEEEAIDTMTRSYVVNLTQGLDITI